MATRDALALPPFGARTNGLAACSWVPLLDVLPHIGRRLLSALGEHGIPACAAPIEPLRRRRGRMLHRVWVDVVERGRAEDVTRHVMRELDSRGVVW